MKYEKSILALQHFSQGIKAMVNKKLELANITLIAVTSVRIKEAIWALKHSSKNIKFNSVKLLTHEDVRDSFVDVIKINKLDYDGYSKFIVYELYKYFITDYVLLIQDDGYVVNPKAWKEDFLKYDYIGAPWGLPQDDFSYRDKDGNIRRVGNGGFSLRSMKLCRLAYDLNLPWEGNYGYYHEDGFICTKNVHIYEENGCRFAPIELAACFSQEKILEEWGSIKPFGFHGKNSKHNIKYNVFTSKVRRFLYSYFSHNGGKNDL